jgi:hypothetical protein
MSESDPHGMMDAARGQVVRPILDRLPERQLLSDHAATSKVTIVLPHIKRRRELWRHMGDGRILRQSSQFPTNSGTAPMAEPEPRWRDADVDPGCAAGRSPRGTDEPRRGRA